MDGTFFYRLKEAVIISKCPLCGTIVKYSGTLCRSCAEKYEKEKERTCEYCGLTAPVCTCNTREFYYCRELSKSMYSYLFYNKDYKVTSDLIFSLKRSADRNGEKFIAREVSREILTLFASAGAEKTGWYIAYAPRGKKAIRKYGFDHAGGLAKRVSRYTGIPFENVIKRKGSGVQKKLGIYERRENADKSFFLGKKARPAGKKYIVIDDVITSGATMKACQELLFSNGASAVFPFSVAKVQSRGAGFDEEKSYRPKKRKKKEK